MAVPVFLHTFDFLQNIAISAALRLAIIPLPHASITKCFLQLTLKAISLHLQNSDPWGIFKCFKSIRAIVSNLFILEYFGERIRPSRTWSSASPGRQLTPPCWRKGKMLRVTGLRVFKSCQRSFRRPGRNWLYFVKLKRCIGKS